MRSILLASAVALVATAAFAGDEIMASRFGNTTITKDGSGNETHLYYSADHTFTGKQGATAFKGTWMLKDAGTICLTSDPAIPNTPNPVCNPISAHKVGDSWSAGPYTISLVAGIQ